ncbi:MAG: hypothetical protein R2867_19690 [Caldilineaceae bacterium]
MDQAIDIGTLPGIVAGAMTFRAPGDAVDPVCCQAPRLTRIAHPPPTPQAWAVRHQPEGNHRGADCGSILYSGVDAKRAAAGDVAGR